MAARNGLSQITAVGLRGSPSNGWRSSAEGISLIEQGSRFSAVIEAKWPDLQLPTDMLNAHEGSTLPRDTRQSNFGSPKAHAIMATQATGSIK
jgi:hypothetical protein